MKTCPHADQLIDFVQTKLGVRDEIDTESPLVSSGLVDSFALIDLLAELERVTQCKIPSGRVSPLDLDSVEAMLELVQRWGVPV